MAEAVGDDKIAEMHESSQQLGEDEGSKDVGLGHGNWNGNGNGDRGEAGVNEIDVVRVERVYRYVKF